NQFLEEAVDVRKHADVGQIEDHPALVEQTHHDAFAVDHRDDRNTDVDFSALHAHLDAAVLWQTLFRDVQVRHDLDAADDRGLKAADFRRQHLRLQQTVDAVPNSERLLLRFDVNITRSFVGGFDQNLIDQADDGSL